MGSDERHTMKRLILRIVLGLLCIRASAPIRISAVKALWEPHISTRVWALTAPDGKHVAMPLDLQHVNVWMMENF